MLAEDLCISENNGTLLEQTHRAWNWYLEYRM